MTRDSAEPQVSFVVPVRNDAVRLGRCLRSIRRVAGHRRIELLVADNGSTDGSAEVARAFGARVLELPDLRVSALRNLAAQVAAGDIVAFVDADHELEDGWLDAAIESLGAIDVGAVGAPYRSPASPTWVQRIYGAFRSMWSGTHDVSWLGSGNLSLRRDVFRRIGGFDATLEACEDVDLCQRLRQCGLRIVSDSRMGSVHHGDPPTLRALFVSELWRGRDNLRVTLRGPREWRDLPSLAIPVIELVLAGVVGVGVFVPGAGPIAAAALFLLLALVALRASLLFARLRSARVIDAFSVMAVAAVYDAARALALIVRARHRRADRGAPAPQPSK
jgi:GT2 family glycosyltransferase